MSLYYADIRSNTKIMGIEETREKTVKAATKLFLREGCKRVTMDDIATAMHISKRTIYEIFANKEELLKACIYAIQEEVETNRKKLDSQVDEPILLAIYLTHDTAVANHKYDTLWEDVRRYYPEVYAYFSKIHTEHFYQAFSGTLKDAQAKGILRPDVDIKQVFDTFTNYLRSGQANASKEENEAWFANVREALYTYMRGLMATEAIQRYDANKERFRQIFLSSENQQQEE